MSDSYFFCMDTETGGLDPKRCDVLTMYIAVTDEGLKIIDGLDLKLKPNDRLPVVEEQAMAINKIDLRAHLENPETVTYAQAKEKITALNKKYLKKRGKYSNCLVLGQNVAFDLAFIQEHIFSRSEWDSLFSYNVEDTKSAALFLKRCQWLPKEIGTLASMVEYFNIPRHTAHEARGDVLMTIQVYAKMIELMKSKKDNGSSQDIVSLLEAE